MIENEVRVLPLGVDFEKKSGLETSQRESF